MRERFKKAVEFAKANRHRQEYQKAGARNLRSAFALALGDFMRAPVIQDIDLLGYNGRRSQTIWVRIEDVVVAGAVLHIRTKEGAELESGPMTQDVEHNDRWSYETTRTTLKSPLVIRIEARDLAGNQSVLEKEIERSLKARTDTMLAAAAGSSDTGLAEFLRQRAEKERDGHSGIARWRAETTGLIARFRARLRGIEELELVQSTVLRGPAAEPYILPSLSIRFLKHQIAIEPSAVGPEREIRVECGPRLVVLKPTGHRLWHMSWRLGGKGVGILTDQAIDFVVRGMVE